MPNWCNNKLVIGGKTEQVLAFVNDALANESKPAITSVVKDITALQSAKLTLRSFLPMPACFDKYDLTNICRTDDSADHLKVGDKVHNYGVELVLTEEIITDIKANLEEQKAFGAVGWYAYNCKTLGTKWDADIDIYDTEEVNGESWIYAYCDTAWSPALEWSANALQRALDNGLADTLQIETYYYELGVAFCGEATAFLADGEVSLSDECYNLDEAPEDFLDDLGILDEVIKEMYACEEENEENSEK